ncbi:Zinc finger protein 696 [Nymphon striatum]|nr:Zinc finger protein 696 [Nymphon striatum]
MPKPLGGAVIVISPHKPIRVPYLYRRILYNKMKPEHENCCFLCLNKLSATEQTHTLTCNSHLYVELDLLFGKCYSFAELEIYLDSLASVLKICDKEPDSADIVKENRKCDEENISQDKSTSNDEICLDEPMQEFSIPVLSSLQTETYVSEIPGDKANKVFHCGICSYHSMSRNELQKHNQEHKLGNRYVCKTCGNTFKRKYSCIFHQSVHSDIRPFTCSYCGRGFNWQALLRKHERLHTGEKPYKCSVCNQQFRLLEQLHKHKKSHITGEPEKFDAETAPEVHEEFAAGKFTAHQTAGDFNGVWIDLALEQTYNREGKTSLFKGITQLESAREKYIKALPFMTSISESVKQMAHMTSSQSDHHEKLRKDDMEAVLQIKRTVEEKMQNPFHPSLATDKLMNISTGQILAATTLVDVKRLGLKAMDAATTTNADKIFQPKMETFATHLKKIQKKIDTVKEVIREESAVTRALCFAQNLSDEARAEAFSYEWLEYPPSLFEPEKNGYSMRKGCKSTYLSTLQAEVAVSWELLKELPPSAADVVYVVDTMAFIQRFSTLGSSTFGQLQERYREKLLNMKPRHCTEVHFVGDQYDFGLKSLKGDERQRRESNINLPEYVPADSMKIPDWKTLLSNLCNKTNMLSYLASRWSQEASWPAGFCLVLGVNAQATRVTQTGHTNVDELYCPNHEEADTRVFAHIASCDDNNAFRLQIQISSSWQLNESAKAVGKDMLALTDTLLISYILSGCDSVSYPFKRGKKRTVKVALEHVDKHPALSNCIRHESGPSAHDQVITEARSFFCDLYGKPGYLSLDKLRAHLFASRKLDLRSLPPTEDAFHFHVLRSLCQISLYKQASLSNPVLLPPEEYGRIVDGDRLIPVMKSKPSKPSAAKLKYCKCKKKPNCLRNCPCAKAAVPCIIACACNGDREKCGRLLTDHYDDDDDE